ncbi:FeoC like transcriptional regulator [Austwickia chelonae]|uniref:Transcriptional regulator HTH-type FeoC domain-containing protein n=1 Tax=Austwickia chelonae NBRC 105200 TaxID=1184607 RepID=K6VPV8_9MICO|nr:FeoC-like transcriptional regulator [Austwickia chelonae]GAB77410.1 hypothetical protein AUCHE_05_03210 [Austwickia chelonae NBRC 105200]SEW09825.1 FeoC like transcriptional regulator [Austwickia chelonae]
MSGPLRQVLEAVEDGAVSVGEITLRTGLDRDVVAASVAHLARIGRVDSRTFSSGCSDAGCGGCSRSGGAEGSGCGIDSGGSARKPVFLGIFSRTSSPAGDADGR